MIRTLMATALLMFATPAFADDAASLGAPLAASAGAPKATPAPKATRPFVYVAKDTDIVIGKKEAPVTIVEYASLSCPHCAHFYVNVLPALMTRYIDTGKAKLVYRHYPLNGPALKAALLVQCADKDRRHDFIKVLFTTQMKWAFDANYTESLAAIGALGGIDRAKFDACMNDKAMAQSIAAGAKQAEEDYGVSYTPTFFINNKEEKSDHGVDSMGRAIDAASQTAKK